MYILIKNQEGENMNLLSQNTDFNALEGTSFQYNDQVSTPCWQP